MLSQIRVAILDDHQSIIDGFTMRLSMVPEIKIVGTALFGEDLEPMLASNPVDVLLLDVNVPNSASDNNTFPILHVIPRLLEEYPGLNILVISMYTQRTLIDALVNTGINGYIFKDDQASIQQLGRIVVKVAGGGIHYSQGAYQDDQEEPVESLLTGRQLEALSLCASHPDCDTFALARELGITSSTMRNLLSNAYLRLGVRTRAAAIVKVHQMGILPDKPRPVINAVAKGSAPLARRKRVL
jgi:two-component system, NarL family, response regulator NreC